MPDKLVWYQASLPYATGGIGTDEGGRVYEAAPIFRWMIGRNLSYIRPWVESRKGLLTAVGDSQPNYE